MSKFNKNVVLLLSALCLHSALAAPIERPVNVVISCPLINDHHSPVKNYGEYLYGSGVERRGNSSEKLRVFRGIAPLDAKIPLNLVDNGYYNQGIIYNGANGAIICKYDTSKGYNSFVLTYMMPDGLDGLVYYEDTGKLKLKLPKKPKA